MMKKHFIAEANNIEARFHGMLQTLQSAAKNGDQEAMATELEYFVNCEGCYKTVDYLQDFVMDSVNRQVILQWMESSMC